MSVKIEMPQLSADGESATLASWLVAVGDKVSQGDVIAELETDKSTVELEAPASGTIGELSLSEGTEDISPGTLLGVIESADSNESDAGAGEAAEPAEKPAPNTPSASATSHEPPASSDPTVPTLTTTTPPPTTTTTLPTGEAPNSESALGPDAKSTPLARRAALASQVNLAGITGTGPRGRVVEADVLRASQGGEAPAEAAAEALATSQGAPPASHGASRATPTAVNTVPDALEVLGEGVEAVRLSAMRKTIARRMTESKQQVPHFYLGIRVSMDAVMATRAKLNAGLAEDGRGIKISVNDFVLRAAALALRDVPAANVQFAGDQMHVFDRVDICVAVATDGGLVTPVVRDADRKGLTKLAEEVKALAGQARDGSLRPEQYQGGTFTISNLGMYGIETVYPILNPPQACILGVGAADEQPVVRDGEIRIGRIAVLTLAADHRAVDGAVGAELLAAIRSRLEDPMGMML